MRRLLLGLWLVVILSAQNPETGQFPTAATDEYLGVVANEFTELTTLSAGVDDTTTTIPLTDASGYPEYTIIRLGNEILHCTTKSTNDFTCARGQQGTTAAAHSAGAFVRIPLTARSLNRITAELKALTAKLTPDRTMEMLVLGPAAPCSTGDGKAYFHVPATLNGWQAVAVQGWTQTVGSVSGTTNFDIDKCSPVTTGDQCSGTVVDLLSTNGVIDLNETQSDTGTPPVISATAGVALVATGDVLRFNIDACPGTPGNGLTVSVTFRKP